ncbi:biotin--[acetyl-CoA-carboxylase] ligase [Ornithinimicrobium sp. LYQ103]|uniref:biotin--[acetyl-CoA-carboxylase] ligase n=1 Tax=Ornithinimicrobium sp. LYQ103 TaxID=3378796 RepID=UPI0038547EED
MTTLRWATPEWHPSLPSTNTRALADPRPGRVVVADHQSAGQGRRERRWESPPGTGMAISAVLPPLPVEVVGWVPLAAGLSVVAALRDSRWPVDAGVKWPNDVLVPLRDDRSRDDGPDDNPTQVPVLEHRGVRWGKVAGVLAQVAPTGAVVVGIGVNVDHTLEQLPVPTATSWRLARGGAPLPDGAREDLLTSVLAHLATFHDALGAGDPGPVRTAYLAESLTLGSVVVVHRPDGGTTQGRAVGLDPSGALVLEGLQGRTVHHAGDVEHLRPQ